MLERTYFLLSRALGRLLRAGRYSRVHVVQHDGEPRVRKRRAFYAPLLVLLGEPLVKILKTGVRVLPQREWEERERSLHHSLGRDPIRIDNGALMLPYLPGKTLAALLDDPLSDDTVRTRAIEDATLALAAFHRHGFTHGDAMAENVMIDVDEGVAHWFDFETVHDDGRSLPWRRADDLRALLFTCVLRTAAEQRAAVVDLIVNAYGDEDVTRLLATSFTTVWQRGLTYHLGQAPLSFEVFREISRLLRERPH